MEKLFTGKQKVSRQLPFDNILVSSGLTVICGHSAAEKARLFEDMYDQLTDDRMLRIKSLYGGEANDIIKRAKRLVKQWEREKAVSSALWLFIDDIVGKDSGEHEAFLNRLSGLVQDDPRLFVVATSLEPVDITNATTILLDRPKFVGRRALRREDFQVGQEVILLRQSSRAGAFDDPKNLLQAQVVKVGKTYVTVERYDLGGRVKFGLDPGSRNRMGTTKGKHGIFHLYTSLDELHEESERRKLVNSIGWATHFRPWKSLPLDTLRALHEVITQGTPLEGSLS